MLQVARLAPTLLDRAAERVVEFLQGQLNEDGGARDRAGKSDLYYTAFVLEGLLALRAEPPRERVAAYLESFGDGSSLDFVHRACLARAWASVASDANGAPGTNRAVDARLAEPLVAGIERCRSGDGGYAGEPGRERGSVYNAFLALGAYQDVGRDLPDAARLAASIERQRAGDGGYADSAELPLGTTPTTAAAATLLRQLGTPVDPEVGDWILARAHAQGGFLAIPDAPMPDLLSTATALHALAGLQVSFEPLRERCLDFVDTLWTGRAFCGSWADDEVDAEYAFYALLALGHLAV